MDFVLAGPFKTKSNSVEVCLPENSDVRQVIAFQDLCAIFIKGIPDASKFQTLEGLEEIETVLEEKYRVHVVSTNGEEGFFGIPFQKDSPYKMIFFVSTGVKNRSRMNAPGEIPPEDNAITRDAVESAISLAKKEVGHGRNIRVGDILISAGIVTKEQVESTIASQESGRKKRIGALLIEKGYITEEQLLMALSAKFRMRFVDLKDVTPNQAALNILSFELIDRLKIFPIEADEKRIIVATSEPTDHTINEILRFNTNRIIELVASPSNQIAAAIEKYFQKPEDSMNILLEALDDGQVTVEEESEDASVRETDSQVIKFVNGILLEAYNQGASDIHMEPKPGKGPLQVRYRLDGDCRIEHQIPPNFKRAILSRIKIMANLDIAERRRPQSGKILLQADRKKIEYRVEITPTVGGHEDAVLRILSSSKPLSLDEMGFSDRNLTEFKKIIAKPYGIILCVGPTGSGKTTSLHSALSHLNKPDRKIWTAEDPVEITQDGLRQVQINHKIGFSFQEALRSFLRADPDIIMIGEMRDSETAKIAIEASLTGHLVFSTLHTNSAPETVVRLIEMGMDPFNFSDAMLGILAQRLVRRLCEKCKKAYHPEKADLDKLASAYGPRYFETDNLSSDTQSTTLMKAVGCPACDHSGFRGRAAIHELLIGSEAVKVAIKKAVPLEELRDLAIEKGMRTLRMDGIAKVFGGQTSIDQIYRVSL